ncbi:hypothetical protein E2320_001512 [Naja naja]|nr:hypothetical protein E2320_001512 [Naja naja]
MDEKPFSMLLPCQNIILPKGHLKKDSWTNDSVRYLGLQFNWKGRVILKHTGKLDTLLNKQTKAPLKPHQRLKLLQFHLVPKFTHELVLDHAHRNTLKNLDCLMYAAVRQKLGLPMDTPLGYFHANVKDGDLGIPSSSTLIPLLQQKQLEKVASNPMTILQIVQRQDFFQSLGHRWTGRVD